MILNSFNTQSILNVKQRQYHYMSLKKLAEQMPAIHRLPFSLKILLENLLRFENSKAVNKTDIEALCGWIKKKSSDQEIAFHPARVLMQDLTGVPGIVDLAAMRAAMLELGGDPEKINPLCPVDLVIDHSVQVDRFGQRNSFKENVAIEMKRNIERYQFLRWGQQAFQNFRLVPPGTGICHQVNLEYLAKGVWFTQKNNEWWAYPDTLVGTDSHTTMINGLGVLGWGVGGIEAEAAMLGQPISMLIPEVLGFKLTGKLNEGVTATDLVLTVTQMLRQKGVVGKFVEFYGDGLMDLSLADRATIANMAPEYGATCGFFPIDQETIHYLKLSGRDEETTALVEAYCKAQGLWHDATTPEPEFTETLQLDLNAVKPSMAGPKRPQDRVLLSDLPLAFNKFLQETGKEKQKDEKFPTADEFRLGHGDVVIAAITSCTNTSNPSVMLAAGLVAKKALEKGLSRKPWVKSSLAPGSQVVTDYLEKSGLQTYLNDLGFNLVGYGCTTCIGNSGPLPEAVAETITKNDLAVCAVLSGNRNFEGRVHPQVRANWLASPPLVVAFALAGTTKIDLTKDPIGKDREGKAVYLKDIWPSNAELQQALKSVDREMFRKRYANVFVGDAEWQAIKVSAGKVYQWDENSTYIQHPPYFTKMPKSPEKIGNIKGARVLAIFGDSVTTDHISPAGSIKKESPAGSFLINKGVMPADFNSYGARRGNHQVMMRGTFANIRIRNEMVPGVEGGYTKYIPGGEQLSIFDAAMKYKEQNIPLIVIAGKEYGTGSSRDWAAKGPMLQGVKAVIAESFERIHRSNLIGMGILPLQFPEGVTRKTLYLTGEETIDIADLTKGIKPRMTLKATIHFADGKQQEVNLLCRIDTQNEVEYFEHGGILRYVLRKMIQGMK